MYIGYKDGSFREMIKIGDGIQIDTTKDIA
jgi:hypothetical protein